MNNAQDRIVAQVAGKPIMESEIDATLMQMGQRAQSYNNPQGRAMILEQLINKKLFLLDAQRNLLEREPAFKEQLGRVKEELLASYNIQKAVEKVRVTDEEVKNTTTSIPNSSTRATASTQATSSLTPKSWQRSLRLKSSQVSLPSRTRLWSTAPALRENRAAASETSVRVRWFPNSKTRAPQ